MKTYRFELLLELYGDGPTISIFSEASLVQYWLDVEASLARAQGDLGIIGPMSVEAIVAAARVENIDLELLWTDARNVGYPILPLVRQLDAALPVEHRGSVHLGATTQDIMDTALALQIKSVVDRQSQLLQQFGDHLAALVLANEASIMVARTHGQHAVPTMLGTKIAVYLGELARHRARLCMAGDEAAVLSLFGAGGTSAAYGASPGVLRQNVAVHLGLRCEDVPRHVARDSLAALTSVEAGLAATCARFAREVIDLSRSEIGELAETDGYLRGASSTMPQKNNPIGSEGVVGLAVCAASQSAAMYRAMEAGHERAAGEWQVEWQALPEVLILCSSALSTVAGVAGGLRTFPDRMEANLRSSGGEVMAEAYMMLLARELGRERAHELVYEAVRKARESQTTLFEAIQLLCPPLLDIKLKEIEPRDYLGDSDAVIVEGLGAWRNPDGLVHSEALPQ